ncbi:MAG TPA: site-specific DNA-methyltransferase [Actinomycetota bacterium]|nr:site-specific DNA-methyltransferase [Actinomycetota bacterium]
MGQRRGPTQTSRFGVSRRENHDASPFYARFTPPELSADAVLAPDRSVDSVFTGDARSMPAIPTASVALVVTSPPYFAGKEYEEALGEGHIPSTYLDYLQMLEEVFAECVRTLEPGGRIAVNVANLGRRPYRSLSSDVITILQDRLRLLLRGEVIWRKARGSTGSCAWGSFQRPANPVLRDLTERVVIASKGRFDRAVPARRRERHGFPSVASLSSDEFMEATTDVWEIAPESATRVGHAAPFPVALPERLIHLYTYYGDLVLDPFLGSGTTAVAAVRAGRHYAGYDIDPAYVALAKRRIEQVRRGQPEGGDGPARSFALPATRPSGGDPDQALREGVAARRFARDLVERSGFSAVEEKVRFPGGIEVSFRACDRAHRPWLFDLAGGFTSTTPGLQRTETLWRVIGRAAVLHELAPGSPLVVLATGVPNHGGPGQAALGEVVGPGKPIADVVVITSADDQARLRGLAGGSRPRSR